MFSQCSRCVVHCTVVNVLSPSANSKIEIELVGQSSSSKYNLRYIAALKSVQVGKINAVENFAVTLVLYIRYRHSRAQLPPSFSQLKHFERLFERH